MLFILCFVVFQRQRRSQLLVWAADICSSIVVENCAIVLCSFTQYVMANGGKLRFTTIHNTAESETAQDVLINALVAYVVEVIVDAVSSVVELSQGE